MVKNYDEYVIKCNNGFSWCKLLLVFVLFFKIDIEIFDFIGYRIKICMLYVIMVGGCSVLV